MDRAVLEPDWPVARGPGRGLRSIIAHDGVEWGSSHWDDLPPQPERRLAAWRRAGGEYSRCNRTWQSC